MQLLKESGKHGRLRAFQRNGETGSFQDKYKHRKGMGGEQLAKGKDSGDYNETVPKWKNKHRAKL